MQCSEAPGGYWMGLTRGTFGDLPMLREEYHVFNISRQLLSTNS